MKKLLLPILCLLIYTCDSDNPAAPIHGCLDSQACNYNEDATIENNSCTYADEGYDCEGSCTLEFDCSGECGGTAVVDCAGTCDGTAVEDNCGVCAGDNSSCSDCAGTPNGTAIIDECGQCTESSNSCEELILGFWWLNKLESYNNDGDYLSQNSFDNSGGSPSDYDNDVFHYKNDGTRERYLSGSWFDMGAIIGYSLSSESFASDDTWNSVEQNGYINSTAGLGEDWAFTWPEKIISIDENTLILEYSSCNSPDSEDLCLDGSGACFCGYDIKTYTRVIDFP